jgi:hypothetical protein
MVEEPSHVKQLSLNHMCKLGLNMRIGGQDWFLNARETFQGHNIL